MICVSVESKWALGFRVWGLGFRRNFSKLGLLFGGVFTLGIVVYCGVHIGVPYSGKLPDRSLLQGLHIGVYRDI